MVQVCNIPMFHPIVKILQKDLKRVNIKSVDFPYGADPSCGIFSAFRRNQGLGLRLKGAEVSKREDERGPAVRV